MLNNNQLFIHLFVKVSNKTYSFRSENKGVSGGSYNQSKYNIILII